MSLLHGCSGLYARGTLIPLPLCPPPMVIVNGSCGPAALQVMVEAGETVTLDASASYSPDSNARLNFTWFQYYEPSSYQASPGDVPIVNLTNISELHGDRVTFTVPGGNDKCVRAEDVTESGYWGEASKIEMSGPPRRCRCQGCGRSAPHHEVSTNLAASAAS
jgi:hypothetical protein